MVELGGAEKDKTDPAPCTLHRAFKYQYVESMQQRNYVSIRLYTTQTCEHFHPVPLFFVIRRLLVCGEGTLAAIITAANSSSLNRISLP